MAESLTAAFRRLFTHMRWADERTAAALRSMREPPAQAVDLYAHMLAAEHVWLRRIQERKPALDVWPSLTLAECERIAADNHAGFATLIDENSARGFDHIVAYANTSGKRFETSLRDILFHVTHHGMYHRGQVALLVRAAGGAPVATDYIAFARE